MASHSAVPFEHGDGDDDNLLHRNGPYATNHRHLQEVHRLSAFQQVATKVPPSYDGGGSWFANEDAIDDWCVMTELDNDKRGPAICNLWKSWPLFVKGAANVFPYLFQQFMNLHHNNGDMLRWITSVQGIQKAWNDARLRSRTPTTQRSEHSCRTSTRRDAMDSQREAQRPTCEDDSPITANFVALIFVSLSDLTQDQRQVSTSLMAYRNRVLADYRLNELREAGYLEAKDPVEGDGSSQLAGAAQSCTATAAAATFSVDRTNFSNSSFMATEEKEAFIAQPLTPTSMVLDLGRTRAMTFRPSAQDLMKFCDQNRDCGIWYNIAETTSLCQLRVDQVLAERQGVHGPVHRV
ncbi:Cpr [Symbiodinium sp. CCMP2456]|nr:Cpr [Symbiodinium sp. CCMP2456]